MSTDSAIGKRKRPRADDHCGGPRGYGRKERKTSQKASSVSLNVDSTDRRAPSPSLFDITKQNNETARLVDSNSGDHTRQAIEKTSLPTAPQKGKSRATTPQLAGREALPKSRSNNVENAIVIEDDEVAAHLPTCDKRISLQDEQKRSSPSLLALEERSLTVEERQTGEEGALEQLIRIVTAQGRTSKVYQEANAALPEHFPLPSTAGHHTATTRSRDSLSALESRSDTSNHSESREEELRKHYVQRIAELGRYCRPAGNATPRLDNLLCGHQIVQRRRYQKLLAELDEPPAQNEPLYCYCNKPEGGEMIGCDGDDCKGKWFHFECAGIAAAPEEDEWFCRDCMDKEG